MTALAQLSDLEAWIPDLPAGNADEALLTRLILAASAFVESWCSRPFGQVTLAEVRDGNGGSAMSPNVMPIIAVTGVTIDGTVIPVTIQGGASGYFVANNRIFLIGYAFNRGQANVLLNYTAGFATPPADITQAVIELVAARYMERGRIGLSSVHSGTETTSYSLKDMPASVATILGQYRRVVPR
jgi:hypothetical protein